MGELAKYCKWILVLSCCLSSVDWLIFDMSKLPPFIMVRKRADIMVVNRNTPKLFWRENSTFIFYLLHSPVFGKILTGPKVSAGLNKPRELKNSFFS
jgi:hypothetical protein